MLGMGPVLWRRAYHFARARLSFSPVPNWPEPPHPPVSREAAIYADLASFLYYQALDRVNEGGTSC